MPLGINIYMFHCKNINVFNDKLHVIPGPAGAFMLYGIDAVLPSTIRNILNFKNIWS